VYHDSETKQKLAGKTGRNSAFNNNLMRRCKAGMFCVTKNRLQYTYLNCEK